MTAFACLSAVECLVALIDGKALLSPADDTPGPAGPQVLPACNARATALSVLFDATPVKCLSSYVPSGAQS